MSKEGLPLQFDLFSGELVDTRSDYQKKKDRERTAPQQMQMFKTPEMELIQTIGLRRHDSAS